MATKLVAAAKGAGRQPPVCDLAEACVWEALGGGWQCLHGGYCENGVSVEWHDFTCSAPRDWARSFHPHCVELCLNLSGHARLSGGPDAALFGPMTAGFYHDGDGELAAWRLPGERHQFLTVEYSRGFVLQHLKGTEAALEVGYSSLSHFSRAFRETMGCCPGLYPPARLAPSPVPAITTATDRQ
jgi:hypothetical protein